VETGLCWYDYEKWLSKVSLITEDVGFNRIEVPIGHVPGHIIPLDRVAIDFSREEIGRHPVKT
jgi:hypothetical protein